MSDIAKIILKALKKHLPQMNWIDLLNSSRSNDYKNPKPKSAQGRSEFQRDYDRVLFSAPLRRLQDKAQVFPLEPHDSVRTRLTHSLEVANVAQSITRQVLEKLSTSNPELTTERINDLIIIAGTCGLVHDLGNPPFGHAGEEAIIEWFKVKLYETDDLAEKNTLYQRLQVDGVNLAEDFLRFDGNPQTLRLLTRLTMLADYDGLSLTLGTLSASFKYIAQSNESAGDDHAREKPGFFFSEKELVRDVQNITGTGNARNPITFIVEAADDIVYSVVDLEDGVKKGAFSWQELLSAFESHGVDTKVVDSAFGIAADNLKRRLEKHPQLESMSMQERNEANAQLFRTFMIQKHVEAVVQSFINKYSLIMSAEYTGELLADGATNKEWRSSKKIARAKVFPNPAILKLELMGHQVIHDLMTLFWAGIANAPYEGKRAHKAYLLLSANYRQVFEHAVSQDKQNQAVALPVEYRRLQLLADYICGMTDTFAVKLHAELFNN